MKIEEKLQELGTAFEEFKKANDASLAEIKKSGSASAETTEKVEKVNKDITRLELQIENLTKAMNRTGNGADEGKADVEMQKKYSEEIQGFMRKGVAPTKEAQDWFKKTMSVDSDQDGGFLVSPEMSSEIVEKVFESSPLREISSVQTISTDSLEIIEDLDEVGSGWVGETSTRGTSSTPAIKKINIPVHELQSSPLATQKLLDDASVNLEAWLAGKVSAKFARDEATAFVSGNGVMKPMGILSYGSGNGFGLIERATTAANNAIVGNDLIALQTLLKEPYQKNAQWLINRSLIGEIRKLKDSQGRYIWEPSLAAGVPSLLLGAAVRMASDLPSAITATTDSIMYGDFKQGYQIVDRIGIRVLRDPYTTKGFVLFYTTKRVGGGVKNFEAIKVLKTLT